MERCEQTQSGYKHKHCHGTIAIEAVGKARKPMGTITFNPQGDIVLPYKSFKVIRGVCTSCHTTGDFRISGTSKAKEMPMIEFNMLMQRQMANPN